VTAGIEFGARVARVASPVPGVAYELNTPDGEIRTGVTDAQGRVSESGIAAGTCAIRFVSNAA